MASFPTSVKSFTSKNTGDIIQAAHVNDLQDEVNAIEAGYLQGTARLNSSQSTVAALSVSGGSTLGVLAVGSSGSTASQFNITGSSVTFRIAPDGITAQGGLQVTGGSTFSAGMTVNGEAGLTALTVTGRLRVSQSTITLPTGESTGLAISSAATIALIQSTGASTAVISTITGISRGQAAGDLLWLNNVGAPTIHLGHAGSSAASSNQLILPNGLSIFLRTHESAMLAHDGTNWRVFGVAKST